MSVEKLNVDNVPQDTTVTVLQVNKVGEQHAPGTPGIVKPPVDVVSEPVSIVTTAKEEIKVEPLIEKASDVLDIPNLILDESNQYIDIQLEVAIEAGKPVIIKTRTEKSYTIKARFLRPGWKLDNLIKGRNVSISQDGTTLVNLVRFNEDIIKYLLKEWNLSVPLVFSKDLDGIEVLSNFDYVTGTTGIHPTVLGSLVIPIGEELLGLKKD